MKKALPIGVVNYREIQTNGYYSVDKTMMIQDFLERKSKVTLITRPRRFGKSSNMSMMAEFFDITKDSKEPFQDTMIMNTEYIKEMNQFPTISISFADCKGELPYMEKFLFETLRIQYEKYQKEFEIENENINALKRVRETYEALCKGEDLVKISSAIRTLSEFLCERYQKKVMIFIDEYDTPFIDAHVKGYYEEIRPVLASLLHSALKDNNSLQYAMLTGIQRVAKESTPNGGQSLFSDLNNLKVFTVKDVEYAQYFGFTKEETKALLEYYDLTYNEEVKEMYDGYRIGNVEIYNPWSIINYADEKVLNAYWVHTSSNEMIKKAMEQSDTTFKKEYEALIEQGYLDTQVNLETSFYEQSNTNSLWGLFINAGYLTITKIIDLENNEYQLRIPNKEVEREFKDLTAYHLHVETKDLTNLYKAIRKKDRKLFQESYEKLLLVNASYFDLIGENSYQALWPAVRMLLLGICLYVKHDYEIISNREEGKGRCDILLKAKKNSLPSYVIELKYMNKEDFNKDKKQLTKLAKDAIQQIIDQKYDADITGEIIHIGLAHAGKVVEMEWIEQKKEV